jgi:hypothetical protein
LVGLGVLEAPDEVVEDGLDDGVDIEVGAAECWLVIDVEEVKVVDVDDEAAAILGVGAISVTTFIAGLCAPT